MMIRRKLKKATRTLKNEGPLIFTKKLASFAVSKARRVHLRYNRYLPTFLRAETGKYSDNYAYLSNPIFGIDTNDLEKSRSVQLGQKPKSIKTATWFVPYFDHINFGGIYTIFRFIDTFAKNGVKNRIVIYDRPGIKKDFVKSEIVKAFPDLASVEVVIFDPESDKIQDLPQSDIGICTFWVSAYFLLRFNQTKRKYYFIQDYEPLFYEGGSTFALAESTYRFGFKGIVNTPGLLQAVNKRHGLEGVSFTPAVDPKHYYPSIDKKNKRLRVFFYARPNNPRNAFDLGILIIKQLIEKYGDKIEIVTAGAVWKESNYDLKGSITNLGLIQGLDEVGKVYRSCDIGFVYMLSKHPSYQPFEFMASGVATVTNNNEDNLWFLKDGVNSLVAEPSPTAMAEKIGWLIEDQKLRLRIQKGGYKTVNTNWNKQTDIIWNDLINSKD